MSRTFRALDQLAVDDEPIAGERRPAMRALATDRPVRNFTIVV
jgi:hypothetical protein